MTGNGELPYTPPPTEDDRDQSRVHHLDSALYNLRHGAAHTGKALSHLQAFSDRMKANPRFDTHYDDLGRQDPRESQESPAEEASETPAEERTEQRALRRGTGPRRADRMARRSDRGRSR